MTDNAEGAQLTQADMQVDTPTPDAGNPPPNAVPENSTNSTLANGQPAESSQLATPAGEGDDVGDQQTPDQQIDSSEQVDAAQFEVQRTESLNRMVNSQLITDAQREEFLAMDPDEWQQEWDGGLSELDSEWQTTVMVDPDTGVPSTTAEKADRAGQLVDRYFDKLTPERKQELANKMNKIVEDVVRKNPEWDISEITIADLFNEMAAQEAAQLQEKYQLSADKAKARADKRKERLLKMAGVILDKAGKGANFAMEGTNVGDFITAVFNGGDSHGGRAYGDMHGVESSAVQGEKLEQNIVSNHLEKQENMVRSLQMVYRQADRNPGGSISIPDFPDSLKTVDDRKKVPLAEMHQAVVAIQHQLDSAQYGESMRRVMGRGLAESVTGDAARAQNMTIDQDTLNYWKDNFYYKDRFDHHASTRRWTNEQN